MVDERGKQLGVMPTRTAMDLAGERGFDLVEVAPSASPPVCRLMDYGRFRYEAARKEREARKINKARSGHELREVRMKTRIGKHDLDAKIRLARRLLGQGAKVRVSVMFRGREITHPELGMMLLKSVAEELAEEALLERSPTMEGRFLAMVLAPDKTAKATPQTTSPKGQKELQRAEA